MNGLFGLLFLKNRFGIFVNHCWAPGTLRLRNGDVQDISNCRSIVLDRFFYEYIRTRRPSLLAIMELLNWTLNDCSQDCQALRLDA